MILYYFVLTILHTLYIDATADNGTISATSTASNDTSSSSSFTGSYMNMSSTGISPANVTYNVSDYLCFSQFATSRLTTSSSCRPVNTDILIDASSPCIEYINYNVPNDFNESAAITAFEIQRPYFTLECPFYGRIIYQCLKYFPRCLNTTTFLPSHSIVVMPLCRTLCYSGQTKTCNMYTQYYFDLECQDNCYYSDQYCITPDILLQSTETTSSLLKIVLPIILGTIGLFILSTVIYRIIANRRVSPILSKQDIERPFENNGPILVKPAFEAYKAPKHDPVRDAKFQAILAQGGR